MVTMAAGSALAVMPGTASAQSAGGTYSAPRPAVSSAKCVKRCSDQGAALPGATVRVSGRNLASVRTLTFLGGRGGKDDRRVKVRRTASRFVEAVVPERARSGRLAATSRDGQTSKPSSRPLVIDQPIAPAEFRGEGGLESRVERTRVYYGARNGARLQFRVRGSGQEDVRVDLVRTSDSVAVMAWTFPDVPPEEIRTVEWDGLGTDGKLQPEGTYSFVVSRAGASASSGGAQSNFRFLRHIFPVRGTHDFGGAEARFGSGREGHSHQGHDVFAKCGTPLVAARGGVVRFEEYHSRAGHYVVIDGEGTDVDYVYMHLRKRSPLRKGDKVFTGQAVGEVGDTGRAFGCHLHFELWSGPGWYEGGDPFDPLPYLKAWDAVS